MEQDRSKWVRADFNGLFGEGLCLSHSETSTDRAGNLITLAEGMALTAFDDDEDDAGNPDDLFASGIVIPAPGFAACRGSRWFLEIDADGVRHESDLAIDGLGGQAESN